MYKYTLNLYTKFTFLLLFYQNDTIVYNYLYLINNFRSNLIKSQKPLFYQFYQTSILIAWAKDLKHLC